MNDKGVCRKAPAKPSLLNIYKNKSSLAANQGLQTVDVWFQLNILVGEKRQLRQKVSNKLYSGTFVLLSKI